MIRTGNEKLDPNTLVLPVAAGAAITEATMVALGTDGYAVPASKAANLTVAGVALEPADNGNGYLEDLLSGGCGHHQHGLHGKQPGRNGAGGRSGRGDGVVQPAGHAGRGVSIRMRRKQP